MADEKKEQVPQKKTQSIGQLIEQMKPQFEKALPKHVTVDRLSRVALTAIRNNQKLSACDGMSLIASIMTAAQLGLEPNTPLGHCYLIPYGNQVLFQIGYQGALDLAYRSGNYKLIKAVSVDKADEFSFAYGLDEHLRHVPAEKPTGEIVKYYAIYKTQNGGQDFSVWTKEKVLDHAKKFSQSWDKTKNEFRFGSAWREHFDGMAKKTVLLDLLKYAPKSIEMSKGFSSDNAILKVNEKDPELTIEADFDEVN